MKCCTKSPMTRRLLKLQKGDAVGVGARTQGMTCSLDASSLFVQPEHLHRSALQVCYLLNARLTIALCQKGLVPMSSGGAGENVAHRGLCLCAHSEVLDRTGALS